VFNHSRHLRFIGYFHGFTDSAVARQCQNKTRNTNTLALLNKSISECTRQVRWFQCRGKWGWPEAHRTVPHDNTVGVCGRSCWHLRGHPAGQVATYNLVSFVWGHFEVIWPCDIHKHGEYNM